MQYWIYDALGNEVGSGSFLSGDTRAIIDIGCLPHGIFMLELSNTNSQQKYKFVHQ